MAGHEVQGILVQEKNTCKFSSFLWNSRCFSSLVPFVICMSEPKGEFRVNNIFFFVHVRLGLHRHKIFHLQCTNFCAECYEYVVPKLPVMKFFNSRIIWYLPLLVCNWLFLRGMYLWQSWGSHTTKSALVCKELPTLSIPFVRKRRTANKLYCTIYLSSVFLILINTGVVALWNNWLRL